MGGGAIGVRSNPTCGCIGLYKGRTGCEHWAILFVVCVVRSHLLLFSDELFPPSHTQQPCWFRRRRRCRPLGSSDGAT